LAKIMQICQALANCFPCAAGGFAKVRQKPGGFAKHWQKKTGFAGSGKSRLGARVGVPIS
jgi:hypothetical protein